MKHISILIIMTLLCLLLVAFIYADSSGVGDGHNSIAPDSELITNKSIAPYPPPSTETPRPYPAPRKPTLDATLEMQPTPTVDPIWWALPSVEPYTDTFATQIDFLVLPTLISYPTPRPPIVP